MLGLLYYKLMMCKSTIHEESLELFSGNIIADGSAMSCTYLLYTHDMEIHHNSLLFVCVLT